MSTVPTIPTPTANSSSAPTIVSFVHGRAVRSVKMSRYSSARLEPSSAMPGYCAHVIDR